MVQWMHGEKRIPDENALQDHPLPSGQLESRDGGGTPWCVARHRPFHHLPEYRAYEEEGTLLQFAGTGNTKASYQLPREEACHHHLHLKCTICGKVIHLDCEQMREFTEHIKLYHGFSLSCDDTVLYGICQDCQRKLDGKH